ncbi:hypothetical protein OC846_002246 [Tilletia horrida]|uniref:Cation/H+ exchanger transmembrane domain-containing protein n=1 Tax=Tilletia horrida TaxID=155126 RepID=A0AAN6GRJ7_9BASI|nr:hypothetical protein OC846_002246 [Tilletia horrida]KAK0568963.1 hypothetical protein OC861_001400 [Tilletia horrida]
MAVELDPSQLNLSLLILGAYIVIFGLFSYVLKEKANVGEAPIAVILGVALGPYGVFNLVDWAASGNQGQADAMMLGLSRIVLGISLFLVGVALPFRYLRTEAVSLFILVGPVMFMMWLVTAICIRAALPEMPWIIAFIVSACTTATDPVLSNSIVKGQFADAYVSIRLRNMISAESGLNDGLAAPIVYLALFLMREDTVSGALRRWTVDTLGWLVLGSVLYGTLIGYLGLVLLRFSTKSGFIDKESFLLYGTGMGIFIVGSAGLLGTDDLLAAFIAGNVFTWDDRYRVDTENDEVTNVIDLLLNQTFFLFVGLNIPFDLFNQPEYGITPGRLVLLSILVLLFRRLPAVLLHHRLIPSIRDPSEAAFAGFFGPIGAGAAFYASLVLNEFGPDDPDPSHQLVRIYIKPLTYALILASIAGHSLAIPVLKAFLVYFEVGRIKLDDSESDFGDGDEVRTSDNLQENGRPDSEITITQQARNSIASLPDPSSSILPPRHFDSHDEHDTPTWRHSSGHKLQSAITRDPAGNEVYFLARDRPSAWTRAARSQSRTRRPRSAIVPASTENGMGADVENGLAVPTLGRATSSDAVPGPSSSANRYEADD